MNRRKLFGILAAAPAAAIAANADNPNTVRIKLPPLVPGQKMVFRNYEATSLEFPKPKCYSVWDYRTISRAFESQYLRNKHNCKCSDIVVGGFTPSEYVQRQNDTLYIDGGLSAVSDMVDTGIITSRKEVEQAFAEACLNGEVPGVWWE
jgi:hypothetical protein